MSALTEFACQDAARRARRADAGSVRLSSRDVTGLLLCAEHYAAPYDLLAVALGVRPARLRGIVARRRAADYAQTGTVGPGPAWCWLTSAGMAACGLGYRARPPALGRLAHIRAVLAARLWLESGQSPGRPGPTGGRGGAANGASAPRCRRRPAQPMCRTRKFPGHRSRPASTRARCGRSKPS